MPNLMEMTPEEITDQLRITAIAQQNDAFRLRMVGRGGPLAPEGRVVVTRSIADMGRDFQTEAILAVSQDKTFTEENDPYGDHCFGAVIVEGRKVWWKIDLLDLAYEYGSEDAANTAVTRRVLTIMFPEDY
ncbi:DUF3768 domain-containing protein [Palleronia rufa]|uniref:DUF3768 domain-containing protein n=1 Tax=Palleronia rufa TaxID=1530186 RepID=UPI00068A8A68|nr:DUF3768 domain-containing protein [Palleronia rufa]